MVVANCIHSHAGLSFCLARIIPQTPQRPLHPVFSISTGIHNEPPADRNCRRRLSDFIGLSEPWINTPMCLGRVHILHPVNRPITNLGPSLA